jgi:hypothetical protein
MSSEPRTVVEGVELRSTDEQSQFQDLPQTSEPVTQVIGDRYMDPNQLKQLLEKKFPGSYKMQVSRAADASAGFRKPDAEYGAKR